MDDQKSGDPAAPQRRRAGRPSDPSKTEAILNAAQALFFRDGLAGTAMEAIAARAGVAKTTLYARFPSKTGLLDAVLSRLARPLEAGPDLSDPTLPIEEALDSYGKIVIAAIARRKIRGVEPLIMMQARRNPQLSTRFFDAGPGRVRTRLTQAIEGWLASGRLKQLDDTDTPQAMAEGLMMSWLGLSILEARMKPDMKVTKAQLELQVRRGNRNFLRLHGTRQSGG